MHLHSTGILTHIHNTMDIEEADFNKLSFKYEDEDEEI